MENYTEENVIYLKDLIFTALRRWKAMVLAALVLALLLGGYKAVSDMGKLNPGTDDAAYQEALAVYEQTRQGLESSEAQQQQELTSYQIYLDNSLRMTMDPMQHYQVTFSFYADTNYQIMPGVSAQNPDRTSHVLNAYQAAFTSGQTLQALAEAIGTEAFYLSEVYLTEIPVGSNHLRITILAATQEDANALLSLLAQQLEAQKPHIEQTIQAHEVRILESSVCPVADPELMTEQTEAHLYLQELQAGLAETTAALAALIAPALPGIPFGSFAKKVILFAIVGAIGGMGIVAAWAWVEMIGGQKIYSLRALRGRTGIKVLGSICPKLPKNPIDRWLMKLEGRELSQPESRAEVLAADIRNRLEETDVLLVTGDMHSEDRAFLTEALTKAMPKLRICDCGSILEHTEAVNALHQCTKVLLVEKCGCSRYDRVVAQCQKALDYDKQILGCILIGG